MVATAEIIIEDTDRSEAQKRADRKFALKKSLQRKLAKLTKREEKTEFLLNKDLTPEESALIQMYRDGVRLDEIGQRLGIGDRRTVAVVLKRIIDKYSK